MRLKRNKNDFLFDLILTLKADEKRFIRSEFRFAEKGEKAGYLLLFDELCLLSGKGKSYEEESIIRKHPSLGKGLLPWLKQYLYEKILSCLVRFHTTTDSELHLKEIVCNIRILMSRNLNEQAEIQIEKGLNTAAGSERDTMLMELLRLRLELLLRNRSSFSRDTDIFSILERMKQPAKAYMNMTEIYGLMVRADRLHIKKGFKALPGEWKEFDDKLNFFLQNDESILSGRARFIAYNLKAGNYVMANDYRNAYEWLKKGIAFLEGLPELISENKKGYFILNLNLFRVCASLEKWQECDGMQIRLIGSASHTPERKIMALAWIYLVQTDRMLKLGKPEDAFLLSTEIEEKLKEWEGGIFLEERISLLFYLAKIHCIMQDYSGTIEWVNRILPYRKENIREDLYSMTLLLNMIAHLELGHPDVLDSLVISYYRYVYRRNDRYMFETLLIRFFRNDLPDLFTPPDIREGLIRLKNDLLGIKNDFTENEPLEYFDLISWLDSKIENRSMVEIIKKKAELKQ